MPNDDKPVWCPDCCAYRPWKHMPRWSWRAALARWLRDFAYWLEGPWSWEQKP